MAAQSILFLPSAASDLSLISNFAGTWFLLSSVCSVLGSQAIAHYLLKPSRLVVSGSRRHTTTPKRKWHHLFGMPFTVYEMGIRSINRLLYAVSVPYRFFPM